MKALNNYKKRITLLFEEFLNNEIDNNSFILKLYSFEMRIREENNFKSNENLWFKFYKDDSLATTIRNIEIDLKGNKNNYNYLIENLKIAVKENSLVVHFS